MNNYHVIYTTRDSDDVFENDIKAKDVQDMLAKLQKVHIKSEGPVLEIFSLAVNGHEMDDFSLQDINDEYVKPFVDECDGGGAAGGGDAGGAAAGGDAGGADAGNGDAGGNVAAEMNSGTSTTDVLGKYEPGKGFMGGNFYVPCRVAFPMYRWEVANGGSKRKKNSKKKDKKYAYEKGMKVVVDMFEDEDELNEVFKEKPSPRKLRNMSLEDALKEWLNKKNSNREEIINWWQASQLPFPEEDKHGELGGCEIVDGTDPRFPNSTMKVYYVKGHYKDGTFLDVCAGPRRGVAAAYIFLHDISVNKKRWEQLKDYADQSPYHQNTGYYGINQTGELEPFDWNNNDECINACSLVKFPDGIYIRQSSSDFKVGPFDNPRLARVYAKSHKIELEKKSAGSKTAQGKHLEYPTFAFTYDFRGVPCVDLVVAEDLKSAMKKFDFQWHVFDNTRPTRDKFNSLQDLQTSLRLLRITDIEVIELDADDVDEWHQIADETKNPATNPSLQRYCRNPRFRYILGRDQKTGRSIVDFRW